MMLVVLSTSATPYHHSRPGFVDTQQILHEAATDSRDQRRRAVALQAAAAVELDIVPTTGTTLFNPTDYGGDPTGAVSSQAAFNAAISAMLSVRHEKDAQGFVDLGGATLDLSGGIFLLTAPISFPDGYSNFRIQRGTLLAAPHFPAGKYMLSIGGATCVMQGQAGKVCSKNVDVSHMTFDGAGHASGCLSVNHTMNVNVGPAIMVTSFTAYGITLGSGVGAG